MQCSDAAKSSNIIMTVPSAGIPWLLEMANDPMSANRLLSSDNVSICASSNRMESSLDMDCTLT